LNISNTFAVLNTNERATVKNAFLKYEINISKFTQKEQVEKVEKLIQSANNLLNTKKIQDNVFLYDILIELKNLAQDKHNLLT
jgi:hypothetical protein